MWRRFCKQIILVWCHRLSLSSLTRSLIWNTTFWTFHNRNIHNFYVLCKLSARSLRQMLCCSHIKIWNLANHMKKWNKEHQTLSFQFFNNNSSILMFFVSFFHVVWKISNSNMWTRKHLAQVSCTELTLPSSP